MNEILENIKTYLLTKYSTFQHGHANVSKPNGSDVIIDSDGQTYAGIADNLGNYFYIRSLKETTYQPVRRGARIPYYEARTTCRIVASHTLADEADILQILLNSISSEGCTATSSDIERTRVFKTETGKDPSVYELPTLVALNFDVIWISKTNNCSLTPCDC